MTELPSTLRLTPSFPFVGRASELAALRRLIPGEGDEGRRVALLGGEPGAGKSRLVRELAREAARAGAHVLYGACDAVVRTPYRPFADALRELARAADPGDLRADLGAGGGELTRLVPELTARVGPLPEPVAADPDTARHRLHVAFAELLAAVGRRRPVVLIVEDGHWADPPTLVLLRHLARSAGDARMLLLATFRDSDADVPAELAEALADLRRAEDVVRLRLGGLTDQEVALFVQGAAGGDLGAALPEIARTITELTRGNAFLVTELWRALVETGGIEVHDGVARLTRPPAELGTPESVREVTSRRLARLAEPTTELLELAAVAGPEFDLAVLRAASGLDRGRLGAAVEEARASGMLEDVASPALRYRFTHELVRRALYDRLGALPRAELHLRVGEAIEAAGGAPSGRALADLAHHFAAAAALGDTARAVDYNVRAARAAMTALAYDEAADRLRTALELGVEPAAERARVRLELGWAHHRAGRTLDALDAFRGAARLARELRDADMLGQAAFGFEEACWRPGIADEGAVELLEEAAAALGEQDSELRVGVLGGLARALAFRGEHERGMTVRGDAIAMARRLGDRRGLATVLMRSYWARGTTSVEDILAMLTEARDLAIDLGDIEVEVEAMSWRVAALMSLGDLAAAERETAAVLARAGQLGQPFLVHVAEHYASAIALSRGRLDEAEASAERSRAWSRLLTGRDPSGIYGIQMFSIRREQGRLGELLPPIRLMAAEDRDGPAWRPGLVALLAELGLEDAARRELARIRANGLDALRDALWLGSLIYLADAATALGDEDVAALVLPELRPYAGSVVMIGHGVAFYGAADRHLGMLAATLGEWDLAERHFETALARNRALGADTWQAHTLAEYGRARLARGARDDGRDAAALLAEAARLAERIGMPTLLTRVRALGAAPAVAPHAPDGLSAREVDILRLVARGLSNREIGRELFISEHTAANHIRSILRKTSCANRTEAAGYAHRHGLVSG